MDCFVVELNRLGTVAVDDTILVKGAEAKAGSHILDGFVPLFDAEVVNRLSKAGYTIYGKTHVGEFGLDLVGETSYYGICHKSDGVITCASAEAVASGIVKQALCVDVNGSPRRGAAISGVNFLKPTYGTVSRYGLIPTACSGEQIGVCASCASDIADVMSVIAGHDPKDGTSLQEEHTYSVNLILTDKKIALIKELYNAADDAVRVRIDNYVEALKNAGLSVDYISISDINTYATAWQIMLSAETCNNISRYDGVKFGFRAPDYKDIDELYINSRTIGFGITAKLNVLYGSYVLSKNQYLPCYDKSLRIRRLASEKMKEIFKFYDAVICPVMSNLSPKDFNSSESFRRTQEESYFTAVPNLTGIPALVTGGIQLWGPAYGDSFLLSIASTMERRA